MVTQSLCLLLLYKLKIIYSILFNYYEKLYFIYETFSTADWVTVSFQIMLSLGSLKLCIESINSQNTDERHSTNIPIKVSLHFISMELAKYKGINR